VIRLEIRDDEGDPARSASLFGALATEGVPAVLGPLTDAGLRSAAESRRDPLLLSPTARVVPEGMPGVFSLTGVAPEGPGALARHALSQGLRSAAIFHARNPQSELEARYFRRAFEDGGGRIVRTVTYAPGTTNFQGPMHEIRSAAPAALALFLPPEELPVVAPQITYFGVDDLDIQFLGGEGWTEAEVLRTVDPRHTDGIVAVTGRDDVLASNGAYRDFVRAYEDHFQRTLRSPTPALGYDAARLVVEAYRRGARSPAEIRDVLEGLRDFPGATGRISMEDGRLVREHRLVRIENRQLVPLDH